MYIFIFLFLFYTANIFCMEDQRLELVVVEKNQDKLEQQVNLPGQLEEVKKPEIDQKKEKSNKRELELEEGSDSEIQPLLKDMKKDLEFIKKYNHDIAVLMGKHKRELTDLIREQDVRLRLDSAKHSIEKTIRANKYRSGGCCLLIIFVCVFPFWKQVLHIL